MSHAPLLLMFSYEVVLLLCVSNCVFLMTRKYFSQLLAMALYGIMKDFKLNVKFHHQAATLKEAFYPFVRTLDICFLLGFYGSLHCSVVCPVFPTYTDYC